MTPVNEPNMTPQHNHLLGDSNNLPIRVSFCVQHIFPRIDQLVAVFRQIHRHIWADKIRLALVVFGQMTTTNQ